MGLVLDPPKLTSQASTICSAISASRGKATNCERISTTSLPHKAPAPTLISETTRSAACFAISPEPPSSSSQHASSNSHRSPPRARYRSRLRQPARSEHTTSLAGCKSQPSADRDQSGSLRGEGHDIRTSRSTCCYCRPPTNAPVALTMVEPARRHGPFDTRYPVRPKLAATTWELQPDEDRLERLDWSRFLARFLPNSGRHDFDALAAYESYR